MLILAAGFQFGSGTKARPLLADPGPLSAKHASFTATQGCAACHAAHDQGVAGLARAVFSHNDMTGKCAECHTFAGTANLPHDDRIGTTRALSETDCRMCHTEHRGATASITPMTDAQCNTCHQVKFASFTRGHPAFAADYPHRVRDGIRFNHAKHLGDYFTRAGLKTRAPQECAGW